MKSDRAGKRTEVFDNVIKMHLESASVALETGNSIARKLLPLNPRVNLKDDDSAVFHLVLALGRDEIEDALSVLNSYSRKRKGTRR